MTYTPTEPYRRPVFLGPDPGPVTDPGPLVHSHLLPPGSFRARFGDRCPVDGALYEEEVASW